MTLIWVAMIYYLLLSFIKLREFEALHAFPAPP